MREKGTTKRSEYQLRALLCLTKGAFVRNSGIYSSILWSTCLKFTRRINATLPQMVDCLGRNIVKEKIIIHNSYQWKPSLVMNQRWPFQFSDVV
jgi:hypothetical protein